jgi:hypothetical protein
MTAALVCASCFCFSLAFGQSTAGPSAGDSPPGAASDLQRARDLAHEKKTKELKLVDLKVRGSLAPLMGEGNVALDRERLKSLPPNAPPLTILTLRSNLADHLLAVGDIQGSIDTLGECVSMFDKYAIESKIGVPILRKLAMAYMRLGERANCVAHHNQASCIFPLAAEAVHTDRTGAEKARDTCMNILSMAPFDLTATWLLNVAHMQLGTYPASVPAEYLIAPKSLDSEYDVGRFKDIAPRLGLNLFNRAGGSVMEDFDGDGNLDIVFSSMDSSTPLHMFHNNADGTFADISEKVQITGQTGGLNFVTADYDNDGRLDILVLRGAWLATFGDMPDSLLKQMEDGTFRDVTVEAGVAISAPTQTAAFADIDNDGDLDLFIGCESVRTATSVLFPSKLFRNKGNGTFEDITESAGVANNAMCKGCVFGDYDGDGLPDLYVSNMGSWNRLYHNNGDGTFTDVAIKLGVEDPVYSFAAWFFDYNNDGWLDLLVTNYAQVDRSGEVTAYYKNHTTGTDTLRLYENDGHGGFRDVTRERHLDRVMFPMGCNFGDFDNDGYPDLYFGTGDPDFISLWPNIALRNDRGLAFQDVTKSAGLGHLQKGHGVSFGDLNNDGNQDLLVEMGGALKDDCFWDALYENPGHANHWITVRLTGVSSNHFAVGSRVRVNITEPTGTRDVYGFVGSNSSFGGNSLQQELGLGQAQRINFLEVFWPKTHATQRFENVPLDQFMHVREDSNQLEIEKRKKFSF